MTDRERIETAISHGRPDRVPWSPRIKLWYEAALLDGTMPENWQGLSQREVEQELGMVDPARDGKIMRLRYDPGVEIDETAEQDRKIEAYHTPVGTVRRITRLTDELDRRGLPGRVEHYPIQRREDYRVWSYIVEHSHWEPSYEAYLEYDRSIGDSGLPMVSTGDVPFHEFLLNLAGYDQCFYHLVDFEDEVAGLLSLMAEVQRERLWPVLLNSPATLLQHGVHLSSQFTPPHLFRKFILPYYQELLPLLHDRGKRVAMHADNDTSQILELLEECGFDVLECFVTEPMVPLTMERARKVLGTRVTLWGGIPSTILSAGTSEQDFQSRIRELFRAIGPGESFILGVADNVMPDSIIERVEWIGRYVEQHGRQT